MQRRFLLALLLIPALASCIWGATAQAQQESAEDSPAAVVHNGQRLFVYYSKLDGLTPAERAVNTSKVVRDLSQSESFDPSKIQVVEEPGGTSILYDTTAIATASIDDAKIAKDSTTHMARQFAIKLRQVLKRKVEEVTAEKIAIATGMSIAVAGILLVIITLICRLGSKCGSIIKGWRGSVLKGVRIQQAELISADMMSNLLVAITHISQVFLILVSCYTALLIVLDAFPQTRDIAEMIRATSLQPILDIGGHMINYLPNLFFMAAIGVITYGAVAFSRFFFDALESGTISFSGFDPDWARPSYNLTRMLIFALALVMALPYFPGWESDAFKQVGLFFGLLLSLGSTQVIGHVMGGTVLTYTNAFKTGDRVKIASHTGDVVEKTMFVTRLRTPKNEIVSIPNGQILGTEIINYSRMASQGELVLYTSITIGYDVPWRQVRDLLLSAAAETEKIVSTPEPYVLATSLNDFTVTYELNASTDSAADIPQTYSNLHRAILDRFNNAGVEIMSPHIFSLRDGNDAALPPDCIPKGHKPKQFRVGMTQ